MGFDIGAIHHADIPEDVEEILGVAPGGKVSDHLPEHGDHNVSSDRQDLDSLIFGIPMLDVSNWAVLPAVLLRCPGHCKV